MAEERENEVFVTQRNSRKRLSDRVTSIDIAKGIAILLVIIGHCNHFFDYNSETKVLIYGFHMPLFVILSGCTLRISEKSRVETLSWIALVKKKTLTILVPYFFVGFISILIFGKTGDTSAFSTLLIGEAATTDMNYNVPLWFLPMLFLSEIVFSSYNYIKKRYVGIISITISGIGYFMMSRKMIMPWSLDIALFCQLFLFLGYICVPVLIKYAKTKRLAKHNSILIASCILSSIIYYFITRWNGRVDLNARCIGNVGLFFLHSLVGSLLVLSFSLLMERVNVITAFFAWLGRHSLDILCWHIPAASIFYSHIVGKLPAELQNYIWGKHGLGLAVLLLLVFVIPVAICAHSILFYRKLHEN